ncbi:MAG: Rap1a/Tai family immunity protein [Halioglobus sp.]
MKPLTLLAILALLLPATAWSNSGAWITGSELLTACEDKRDTYKQGLCVGYIIGAADSTTIWELWQDISSNICISSDIEIGDVVDSTVKHLQSNQRDLNFDASSLVLNALIRNYPCEE